MTIEEDAQNKLSSLGISELMEHMRELGKSKQSIDEGCVGCCNVVEIADDLQRKLDECCKVVDIAADLQRKLDECNLTLDLARTTHSGTIKYLRGVCDTRDNTISDLESDIDTKNEVIDGVYERIHNQATSIDGLIGRAENLEKTDREKNVALIGFKLMTDDMQEHIESLEAELSARKEDSEVLMKVVEAVRKYDGSYKNGTMNSFARIYSIVVDYLDAPEDPEDTPIDEPNEITVKIAWLELP